MNITIDVDFFLLLGFVFFIGYFFGRLIKNFRWWKILPILVFGAYFESVIRSNSLVFITALLSGFAVNYIGLFFSVLSWARNLGDIIFAFRYRRAYEDLRRREEELNERERKLREKEKQGTGSSHGQGYGSRPNWQQEAKGFRQKQGNQKTGGSTGAGRGGASSSSSSRQQGGSRERTSSPPPPPQSDVRAQHLRTLGLEPGRDYSLDEIKKAYRQRVKKVHPDAGGSQNEFIAVQNAYEWLRAIKNT